MALTSTDEPSLPAKTSVDLASEIGALTDLDLHQLGQRASTRHAHEAEGEHGEGDQAASLRHLHPGVDRIRARAGIQLASRPSGILRGQHQEPGPRRLAPGADEL